VDLSRSDIIGAARAYLGVPYLHQGRTRQGLDCVGLLLCVAHDLGITDYEIDHYSRVPSGRMMQRLLAKHVTRVPLSDLHTADILHIAFQQQPQHLAFVTDKGMIHADSRHGVVEHHLVDPWRSRIRAAYRVPGVE